MHSILQVLQTQTKVRNYETKQETMRQNTRQALLNV